VDRRHNFWYYLSMSNQQIIKILKTFQDTPAKSKMRREYLTMFEKKMAYRTTKTENPEVTLGQVEKVFRQLAVKHHG